MLRELHLRDVGPSPSLDVEFAERLNVFTGDNGLGKTFLLDCAWWALTGSWPGPVALPGRGTRSARIGFIDLVGLQAGVRFMEYNYQSQAWPHLYGASKCPAVYLRTDGGISVFEPVRNQMVDAFVNHQHQPEEASIHFDSRSIWDGMERDGRVLCNGMIRDLIQWQFSPDRGEHSPIATFERVLSALSHPEEPVKLGPPARIYVNDARQYPTLELPHETLPIHLAPSGLKRILGLAYVMVWAQAEHRSLAALTNSPATDHLDVLIDEVELHLHPKWQRSILPSLLGIGDVLRSGVTTQFFVTTHAPMVLASIEPGFDDERDRLFHFDVEGGKVELNEIPWCKQGDAGNWLTSPIFGLDQPRSIEAERAIAAANALMRGALAELPEGLKTKEDIHEELCRVLPDHDRFWPRWIVQDPEDNDDQVGATARAAEVRAGGSEQGPGVARIPSFGEASGAVLVERAPRA